MRHASLTIYDDALSAIRQFAAFPAMRPYIGPQYSAAIHKRMLVVGESFYFPDDSTIHRAPSTWYRGSQSILTDEEIAYIHCRHLVQCDWKSPGHKMYRELNACLGNIGLPQSDKPISHICFMNTFCRPAAIPGSSFKHCCCSRDIEEAKDVLNQVMPVIKPEVVVFASKFSWESVGQFAAPIWPTCKFAFVSHPTDPFHWNVVSYRHGRTKFMDILRAEFLCAS